MKANSIQEKTEIRLSMMRSLYRLQKVCLFVFDRNDCLIAQEGQEETQIRFLPDARLRNESRAETRRVNKPCLYTDANRFIYGVFEDEEENLYLCGPVSAVEDRSGIGFAFYERYGISAECVEIPFRSYIEVCNLTALWYTCMEQKPMEDTEIMTICGMRKEKENRIEDEMVLYNYQQSLDGQEHYGQQREEIYCKMVEEGDVDGFLKIHNTDPDALNKVGDFAKDGKKKLEYLFVSALILTRVAAARGGMSYLESCNLSDLYLRRLEKCEYGEEILSLLYRMRLDYIRRVQKIRASRQKSGYVEYCKDEISRNLTKPFSRKALAEKLGLNAEYLSALFKEKEGMTLTEYRTKVRLEAAANLLKYSKYSIADISERFLFPPTSSFAKYFKEEYHMTPREYRNQNQKILFGVWE